MKQAICALYDAQKLKSSEISFLIQNVHNVTELDALLSRLNEKIM